MMNQARSSTHHLTCGVPQGSVLGPLVFVMYIKDVTTIIRRHGLLTHRYSDDTKIYFYCKPEDAGALAETFATCINELCTWVKFNRLKRNCDKTKCLLIRSSKRSRECTMPSLSVGGIVVKPTTGECNLGVLSDDRLDMKQHISNVCHACYFQLCQLRVVVVHYRPMFYVRCCTHL